ncbi:MAG: spermidine/putrescine transport system permease protein [Thermoleophilaceae bacterium]|jgi:spermidine/putrescine transport system permease protein|nr:spermidine/putrescine transport system permease protein [Thermoleophilaceae bacterium]
MRRLRAEALTIYAALAFLYLMLPIMVVIAFSFNNPKGRFNFTWQGFTVDNWLHPFNFPGLGPAVRLSLEIAALSAIFATILGTMIAMSLVRYGFRGRGLINTLIFLPMTTPEIVMGASLLTLFLNRNVATGFATILIAHIMFNISYVVVTVKARLVGFDRHLEEAAMDLGATPWVTFRKVTLPLIAPGIMSAALIAFALSVDDFVITYFNAGSETTFPLFVWGSARVAVPPQINVIGSMIFLVAIVLMFANIIIQRRRGDGSPAPLAPALGGAAG